MSASFSQYPRCQSVFITTHIFICLSTNCTTTVKFQRHTHCQMSGDGTHNVTKLSTLHTISNVYRQIVRCQLVFYTTHTVICLSITNNVSKFFTSHTMSVSFNNTHNISQFSTLHTLSYVCRQIVPYWSVFYTTHIVKCLSTIYTMLVSYSRYTRCQMSFDESYDVSQFFTLHTLFYVCRRNINHHNTKFIFTKLQNIKLSH